MKSVDKELTEWFVDKIENEYKGEISLVLGRKGACKIPTDSNDVAIDYFIPACDHGFTLARTFIIGDKGYDFFPMSWERVEGLAALNENLTFCLADSVILYSKSDADTERFELLKKTLMNNLQDKDFIRKKSLEKMSAAMEIYKNMIFETSLCSVRKAAGVITQYLHQAIATINGTYPKGDYGYAEIISQVGSLKNKPEEFTSIYERILRQDDAKEIINLTFELIRDTREFLKQYTVNKPYTGYSFNDLAGWYEESKYTFRRIKYACENNQYEAAFSWSCYIQIELDILSEESGMDKMNLLDYYDKDNLRKLYDGVDTIEQYILSVISKYNVTLRKYKDIDEFLKFSK